LIARIAFLLLLLLPAEAQAKEALILKSATPHVSAPELPDISQYTLDWVNSHIPERAPSKLTVTPIYKVKEFREFTEGNRALEWVKRQDTFPKLILIKSGVATLEDIYTQIDKQYITKTDVADYLVKLPIVVSPKATLIISHSEARASVKLSTQAGALIINQGQLFIINSDVTGWDESKKNPVAYESDEIFRPFIVGFSRSKSYFYGSRFQSLGYFAPKAYGIVFSITSDGDSADYDQTDMPKAWLINNSFEKIYYGFYCYYADDIVIIDNRYTDNIVYGIDPHDYSNRLIIANNHVTGTREKHGIIVSREVDNSWIIGNTSNNNKGAGFMLDRQSSDNLIAYNVATHNGSDGISIYESPDNLIYGNIFYSNNKHGIRIRNSTGIISANNVIKQNGQLGTYLYTSTFSAKQRDLKKDFYQATLNYTSFEDQLISNEGGGPVKQS